MIKGGKRREWFLKTKHFAFGCIILKPSKEK
jgi:hypothetical protein